MPKARLSQAKEPMLTGEEPAALPKSHAFASAERPCTCLFLLMFPEIPKSQHDTAFRSLSRTLLFVPYNDLYP